LIGDGGLDYPIIKITTNGSYVKIPEESCNDPIYMGFTYYPSYDRNTNVLYRFYGRQDSLTFLEQKSMVTGKCTPFPLINLKMYVIEVDVVNKVLWGFNSNISYIEFWKLDQITGEQLGYAKSGAIAHYAFYTGGTFAFDSNIFYSFVYNGNFSRYYTPIASINLLTNETLLLDPLMTNFPMGFLIWNYKLKALVGASAIPLQNRIFFYTYDLKEVVHWEFEELSVPGIDFTGCTLDEEHDMMYLLATDSNRESRILAFDFNSHNYTFTPLTINIPLQSIHFVSHDF